MHAVLRDFVDTARGWFLMRAVEMVKRARTFANRETIFDGFGDVGFGEHDRFSQRASNGELRGDG